LLLAACGGERVDRTPIETVRHFIEVMDRSDEDDAALKEAFRLLDAGARKALTQRADRVRTLSLQPYEPWQMLVPGRFRLRFAPSSPGGMRERVDGDRAVVTVVGRAAGERADVQLVREQGHWRIALAVPAVHRDTPEGARGDG
jgi:hypothetical protein